MFDDMIGLTAYIECCVKFSIFEVTQQDWRSLHVLAMCDGCFEAMEEQSLLNLLESKNYFQNDQANIQFYIPHHVISQ